MPLLETRFTRTALSAEPGSPERRLAEDFLDHIEETLQMNRAGARNHVLSLLQQDSDVIRMLQPHDGSKIVRWGVNGFPAFIEADDEVTPDGTVCVGNS